MRLRQIEVFYAIYSAGSISKAGELLGVSQPAISKVLRHTEDTLGYALFERTSSGLVPTKEAIDLFEDAAKIFNEVTKFRQRAASAKHVNDRPIKISLAPSLGLYSGPRAVSAFAKQYTKTHIEIETLHYHEAVQALRSEQTDIAISYQPHPREGFRIIPVATANFVCITPKKHWRHGHKNITVNDLNNESIIFLNGDAPLGHLLNSHLESISADRQSRRIVVNTYYIAKALVSNGVGIAIIDEYAARGAPMDDVDIYQFAEKIQLSVGALVRENYNISDPEHALLEALKIELTNTAP